ncbi:MAG: DUF371 domain-containing protein [Candidatus Freyarchaeota archaeon]|nr:DUF371 domain-containing protein [Candidatus Jordarchaeia archaeon]MBS7268351.1 DUF371 domain-containing protein [Candidatus Jordarchaeia archaeon]MBS7278474.1 DUF371 domain-containing protein [Candidatus Jordarchaeia archaeon]
MHARGHPNVSATHRTTLEITTRNELTIRGDCIVAVCADKGAEQLSEPFKELARKENSTITMILKVNDQTETIRGQGSPHLTLTHPHDIVARKSTYHSDRTIMIKADKAAMDLNRKLVQKLKDPQTKVEITLIAEIP